MVDTFRDLPNDECINKLIHKRINEHFSCTQRRPLCRGGCKASAGLALSIEKYKQRIL